MCIERAKPLQSTAGLRPPKINRLRSLDPNPVFVHRIGRRCHIALISLSTTDREDGALRVQQNFVNRTRLQMCPRSQ